MVPPNVPNRSKGKRAGAHGLGRYQEALAAAERVAEDPRGLGLWIRDLFELIEAAVRSGQPERATGPLAKLGEIAHAAGTDWALGSYARSAALLAEGETAERLYREAIERFSRTRGSESLARASPLRRMAAARAPPRRRPRAATSRLRDSRGRGHGGICRARSPRAAGHRRDGAQAHRRDARRADPTRAAGRAPGCRRADEPGDRRPRSRSCSSPTNSTHRARQYGCINQVISDVTALSGVAE